MSVIIKSRPTACHYIFEPTVRSEVSFTKLREQVVGRPDKLAVSLVKAFIETKLHQTVRTEDLNVAARSVAHFSRRKLCALPTLRRRVFPELRWMMVQAGTVLPSVTVAL